MKLHDSVNMHKRKIIFDWRHYRIFYTSVMSLFIFKHACADNYLKSFHSIAMKLHDSSNRQFMKDQIRLVFLCHFFLLAIYAPFSLVAASGDTSNSQSSRLLLIFKQEPGLKLCSFKLSLNRCLSGHFSHFSK